MNKKIKTSIEKAPVFFRYFAILSVVALISALAPKNAQFKYEYEQGQTWRYEDLVAPFDFPIMKTPEEVAAAKAEMENQVFPYFSLDTAVKQEQKKRFATDFQKQLANPAFTNQFKSVKYAKNDYLAVGNHFLDEIYDKGVIDLSGYEDATTIYVETGNTVTAKSPADFYTVQSAKSKLNEVLPQAKLADPDFLLYVLPDCIVPNIHFSQALTDKFKQERMASVTTTSGMVSKGELIIKKDGIVTAGIYKILQSYQYQYERELDANRSWIWSFFGYFLLAGLVLGVFTLYLRIYEKDIFSKFSNLLFILFWFVLFGYFVYVVERIPALSTYMIPFVIVPIVMRNFFSAHLAFFTHVSIVLIASFLSSLGYEFTFLQILAGFVAILWTADARDWSKFFKSIFLIFIVYAVTYFGLSLISSASISDIDWSNYVWLAINTILILIAFPLVPLLERVFGFTSAISLVELSDLNKPLMRELATKAPGTLQHSLQVGNLASSAADAIGADSLLLKVAALYHDIGKIRTPEYFIENQNGKSPHDDISPFESAKIIIEHVTEGEKLAKKYKIPKLVRDFILTHHGTTRVEYFYRNYIKNNPEKQFDESLFRYPGPKPQTKEQAIMMIADSIEAASKSLKNPTEQDINNLVDNIVSYKIENGQLEEAKITFKEVEICKSVFKKLLKSINHVRIEYPDEVK